MSLLLRVNSTSIGIQSCHQCQVPIDIKHHVTSHMLVPDWIPTVSLISKQLEHSPPSFCQLSSGSLFHPSPSKFNASPMVLGILTPQCVICSSHLVSTLMLCAQGTHQVNNLVSAFTVDLEAGQCGLTASCGHVSAHEFPVKKVLQALGSVSLDCPQVCPSRPLCLPHADSSRHQEWKRPSVFLFFHDCNKCLPNAPSWDVTGCWASAWLPCGSLSVCLTLLRATVCLLLCHGRHCQQ